MEGAAEGSTCDMQEASHHSAHAAEWSRGSESGLPHLGFEDAAPADCSTRGGRFGDCPSFEVDQESGQAARSAGTCISRVTCISL